MFLKNQQRAKRRLTKKAEPPATYDFRQPATSRTTDSDNAGWLRRLVRCHGHTQINMKKSVNHPLLLPIAGDTCHATHQSSTAQLFSSSLDQETALAGLRGALQQMQRTESELKSNHGCLAVEEAHQLFGLHFVCTKYRTPRQLLRKAWRQMAAAASDHHREICAPTVQTSRLLLAIVQVVALDSWRVRMTPNVES